jgi:hypothetical protein
MNDTGHLKMEAVRLSKEINVLTMLAGREVLPITHGITLYNTVRDNNCGILKFLIVLLCWEVLGHFSKQGHVPKLS